MKISDRTLGYLSVILLMAIFIVVAYCMYDAHHEPTINAYVDFEELGSLQPEDEVVVRGYTVGSIGSVTWLGDRARVQVRFTEPIVIREGTQFNNVNYAIMGQRRLEIIPSKTGKVLSEDFIHTGNFEPGIAEVLRHIENVNDQVAIVRKTVHMLVEGDSSHESAVKMFENAMATIEGTIQNTNNMLSKLQPAINNVFVQVDTASQTLLNATMQADSAISTVSTAINEKLSMADSALKVISEGARQTDEIITNLQEHPLANNLFNSTQIVDQLNTLVSKVNELIQAIDTKGIKVLDENGKPVQLFTWKNINLIGKTAREKAIDRAEAAKTGK